MGCGDSPAMPQGGGERCSGVPHEEWPAHITTCTQSRPQAGQGEYATLYMQYVYSFLLTALQYGSMNSLLSGA